MSTGLTRYVPRILQETGMVAQAEVAHYTHLQLTQYVKADEAQQQLDTLTAELAEYNERLPQWAEQLRSARQDLARVTGERDALEAKQSPSNAIAFHISSHECAMANSCQLHTIKAQLTAAQAREGRLREEFSFLIDEVDQYTTERQYHSRDAASKDLDRREKALLARLAKARAALTEPTSS